MSATGFLELDLECVGRLGRALDDCAGGAVRLSHSHLLRESADRIQQEAVRKGWLAPGELHGEERDRRFA